MADTAARPERSDRATKTPSSLGPPGPPQWRRGPLTRAGRTPRRRTRPACRCRPSARPRVQRRRRAAGQAPWSRSCRAASLPAARRRRGWPRRSRVPCGRCR
jgi:hypothetical protein